jgi:2-keto-4-pentenoate hydratase
LALEGALQKEIDGQHPNADPLVPLYWLANFLSSRGVGLKAGQIVITGSYAGVIDVPLGQALMLRYGDLGQVHFEAQKLTA